MRRNQLLQLALSTISLYPMKITVEGRISKFFYTLLLSSYWLLSFWAILMSSSKNYLTEKHSNLSFLIMMKPLREQWSIRNLMGTT